jgi:hypothetical protein
MAEQTVVEAPVSQTTATTTTVTTEPVVKTDVTPEPDILTKVSQFKLPDTQDKIENPPDQPELASITDPVAKKAAAEAIERMRRGMQSDYTKKLEDAQRLVNQSKSWTPQRIQQELLTNPEFVQAAQMIQGQQPVQDNTLTQEAYSALTDKEKAAVNLVPELRQELQNIKNQANQNALMASINLKDNELKQKYTDYNPQEITQFAVDLQKIQPAEARDYLYKAKMYETNVRKAYEMGKLEGQGKLNSKLNVITPIGSNVVSNEGVPTKQAGESDKAFFVRLGQFRLNQFKNQK